MKSLGKKLKTNYFISDLSARLFWDTDINNISWHEHQAFIVGRVMEYGRLKDWKIIRSVYGLSKIKAVALNLRNLDDFSLAFLSAILQVNKEQFKCYRLKQSQQDFWNY